jgi:hypothetical protein
MLMKEEYVRTFQLEMIKSEAMLGGTKPNRGLSETTPTANLPVKQNPHGEFQSTYRESFKYNKK